MRITTFVSLTISTLLFSTSCGKATDWREKDESSSQNLSTNTEEERTIQNFNAVQASTGINVSFTQSNDYQVKINAKPEILPYVKTKLDGTKLKIYIDSHGKKNLNTGGVSVEVHAPHLVLVQVDSGADFQLKNTLTEENFKLSADSGADFNGSLNITNLTQINVDSGADADINLVTKNADINVDSGANINLKGSADNATINADSAGSCKAEEFKVNHLKANADSSGTVTVYAMQSVEATADSSGSVRYKGNPTQVKVKADTSGSVKKMD